MEKTIRTERFMTLTEAHPYHGITAAGRLALNAGGSTEVWTEYNPLCPLCRKERREKGPDGNDRAKVQTAA